MGLYHPNTRQQQQQQPYGGGPTVLLNHHGQNGGTVQGAGRGSVLQYNNGVDTEYPGSGQLGDGDDTKNLHDIVRQMIVDPNGAYERAEAALVAGVCVNVKDSEGRTPLHAAVGLGVADAVIHLLINYGSDLRAKTNEGDTPLHLAVSSGNSDVVALLIDTAARGDDTMSSSSSSINEFNGSGNTPIHEAIRSAFAGAGSSCNLIINLLIEYGADLKLIGSEGVSAIHLMALHGMYEPLKNAVQKNITLPLQATDSDGDTPLHIAAKKGYMNVAVLMRDQDASLLQQLNNKGESPSQAAARAGYEDIALELDITKANIHESVERGGRSFDGNTPAQAAHAAAKRNGIEEIQRLLSSCCESRDIVGCTDKNLDTPLHIAVNNGFEDVVRILLNTDCGYDVAVNMKNKQGYTPIHVAAYKERCQIIKDILNSQGARVSNHALSIADSSGSTPLHIAAWRGCADVVELLLMRGADVDAVNSNGDTPLMLVITHGSQICDEKIVKLLIDCGADAQKTNFSNCSPLSLCYEKRSQEGNSGHQLHMVLFQNLLFRAAQLDDLNDFKAAKQFGADLHSFNVSGDSSIHIATRCGHIDILEYLQEMDIDMNRESRYGHRPIHLACRYGHSRIVELLLNVPDWKRREIANALTTDNGDTPLHIAAKQRRGDIISLLVSKGADHKINSSEMKSSPLHDAVCENALDSIKVLVQSGADVNAQEGLGGNTPMHLVALWGSRISTPQIVAILMKRDLDLTVKNFDGYTPEELGVRHGNPLNIPGVETEYSTMLEEKSSRTIQGISSLVKQLDSFTEQDDHGSQSPLVLAAVRAPGSNIPVTGSPFGGEPVHNYGDNHRESNFEPLSDSMHFTQNNNQIPIRPFRSNAVASSDQDGESKPMTPVQSNSGRHTSEGSENGLKDLIIPSDQLTILRDRPLGQGSFGKVYLGILHCNKVAIKTLLPSSSEALKINREKFIKVRISLRRLIDGSFEYIH